MKQKVLLGAQILLGLIFFVLGGLNGFFQFIPMPAEIPSNAMAFFQAMMGTGYLYFLLKGTELIFGLLLMTNFFAPLSLVVLAPITLNIFLFSLFTDPTGLPVGIAMLALHLASAYRLCDSYKHLFKAK